MRQHLKRGTYFSGFAILKCPWIDKPHKGCLLLSFHCSTILHNWLQPSLESSQTTLNIRKEVTPSTMVAACYLVLTIIRKIPAPMITTPRTVNIPENCFMPSGKRLVDWKANSAPIIISVNPSSFSIIINPIGLSSLMPEPSRLKFTVPRLILIYLS